MSEPSRNSPSDTSAEQRYADEQTVKVLFQSCTPHQRALLSILAVAERYQLDPAPMVASLGAELPGWYRKQADQLAEELAQGVDADEALNHVPNLMPTPVALAIRVAREEGSLGELYSAILRRSPINDDSSPNEDENNFALLSRLGLRILTVSFLIIFILLKLIPEFSKMLQEFGVEHPHTLTLLMIACDKIAKFWFVGVLIVIAMIPFGIPACRRYLRRWNPFTWRQPEYSRTARRRRSLAVATQSASSPSLSIERMLNVLPENSEHNRLQKAQEKIENGNDVWESLAKEKIISNREAQALALSSSGQTQAWLLRWSASNRQTRENERSVLGTRIFLAAVNIVLAFVVVLAALGVFMTLIAIMRSLY